jgi:hypothetical protein
MSISLEARSRGHFRAGSDAVVNDFQDLFPFGSSKSEPRCTDPFRAEATFLDGEFDELNEFDVDVEVEKW